MDPFMLFPIFLSGASGMAQKLGEGFGKWASKQIFFDGVVRCPHDGVTWQRKINNRRGNTFRCNKCGQSFTDQYANVTRRTIRTDYDDGLIGSHARSLTWSRTNRFFGGCKHYHPIIDVATVNSAGHDIFADFTFTSRQDKAKSISFERRMTPKTNGELIQGLTTNSPILTSDIPKMDGGLILDVNLKTPGGDLLHNSFCRTLQFVDGGWRLPND